MPLLHEHVARFSVDRDFHDLRKAAGSIAARPSYAGPSPKTVQNLLGHSVQQVTTETHVAEFAEDRRWAPRRRRKAG